MNQEYSESEDFKEHRQHIDEMHRILGSAVIPNLARVLDVGGGHGMHACFLAQRFALCYCLDIVDYQSLYDGGFYRLFREKCARNGVAFNDQNLRFIECDAMNMLFRDGYFDLVTSFNAMEHIIDPLKAIEEMVRVTRPGGMIYLTFDPIWTADTGSHFIDKVPEPWAHLVETQEKFIEKMRKAGASDSDIVGFKSGMNQLRLRQYQEIFDRIIRRSGIELVHQSTWSGLADPAYKDHPNYKRCLDSGYSHEELQIRGMQYLLRKL